MRITMLLIIKLKEILSKVMIEILVRNLFNSSKIISRFKRITLLKVC